MSFLTLKQKRQDNISPRNGTILDVRAHLKCTQTSNSGNMKSSWGSIGFTEKTHQIKVWKEQIQNPGIRYFCQTWHKSKWKNKNCFCCGMQRSINVRCALISILHLDKLHKRRLVRLHIIWWGPINLTGSKIQCGEFILELKWGATTHKTGLESFCSCPVNTALYLIMALDKLQLLRWVTISWAFGFQKVTLKSSNKGV